MEHVLEGAGVPTRSRFFVLMRRFTFMLLAVSASALAWACHADERALALARVDEARVRLASASRPARAVGAADAVLLSRRALLEAEASIRSGSPEAWRPLLLRALDRVDIALWVVERDTELARDDAAFWLDAAAEAVSSSDRSPYRNVHRSVAARRREASLALDEARRLYETQAFREASERARAAMDLAGELPEEALTLLARFGDPTNLSRWRSWVTSALRDSASTGRPAIVVDKRAHRAVVWRKNRPVLTMPVELGYNGWHPKRLAGDGATPEGLYRVVRKKQRTETRYYKALLLDYPNAEDRERFERAKARGEIENADAIGGLIEIHGEGGRGTNWTDGCVAVTNEEMDRLFDEAVVGSPVAIVGTHGALP